MVDLANDSMYPSFTTKPAKQDSEGMINVNFSPQINDTYFSDK